VQSDTRQQLDSGSFQHAVNVTGAIDGDDVPVRQGETRPSVRSDSISRCLPLARINSGVALR
jgi:hypothetical protein